MTMKARVTAALASLCLATAGAAALAAAQTPPAAPQQPPAGRALAFLTPATAPDAFATIPPAPLEGEPRNNADWAIFKATRALEGGDRWKLAQSDNSYRAPDLVKSFSCAIDAELTAENAPTVVAILTRTTTDAGMAAERAKQIYKRTRPYLHNAGNTCIDKSDALTKSFDYPSGHASLGWTAGLVIAELAPDRATQVMARARAYGESRIVCGVHNWSAVEAGRTNAAGVYAALHSSREFLDAMAKAKLEIDAARKAKKPNATACAKEFELTKPLAVQ
jgi:acid phosphatase (class A)